MTTVGALIDDVLDRLGDLEERIWTHDEVGVHLVNAQQQIASAQRVFFDWVFLENLPTGFSYTQPWELTYGYVTFDIGVANYTIADERRLLGDERLRLGPGWFTCPIEATDGWLSSAHANTAIPATAELPKTLTALSRVTWDKRGIDAMTPSLMNRVDARYQITRGEVYGFMWQVDGIRTLRKIRVPSAQASTVTVTGSWGLLRRPTDLSTDPITGAWGSPRRIAGHHPLGAFTFGAPRRPFLDGTNVRVEHFRHGRPLAATTDVCELPTRYARYLRDYAQARLLERAGPGQDVALAAHFDQRWARGLARIANRIDRVDRTRVAVLGGDGHGLTTRPPRPSRPWPYGTEIR
jgi:hypothetical protein